MNRYARATILLLAVAVACDSERPATPVTAPVTAPVPVVSVDFADGARPMTVRETHAYVALSAEILCLSTTENLPWSPSSTTPEITEAALACLQYWAIAPETAEAIDRAHRYDKQMVRDINEAAETRCRRSPSAEDSPHDQLTHILLAARLRWTNLDTEPSNALDEDARRYLATARALACLATAGGGQQDLLTERSAILARNGYETASFREAGLRYRVIPAMVARVAAAIRECAAAGVTTDPAGSSPTQGPADPAE